MKIRSCNESGGDMRKGIRLIASVLAGAIFMLNTGITSYAEDITYLSEEDVEKTTADGKEKKPEEIKQEIIAKAMGLPIETNQLKNWPKGPEICGEAGIVMDMDDGAILYGKSIDRKYYPASITKIMTALVALENSEMTDVVTFSEQSLACQHSGYAHIAMKKDEQISMKDALYAMMLASANEVAYAIGENVGGTYDRFVEMMNERAKELGCENTHFMNTNGMFDENHYVSARDMALITKEAFSKKELLEIMQTPQYTIPVTNVAQEERTFQQKHRMMVQGKYYDSRCFGGKTGYTDKSYNTLVTAMEENGRRIVIVILGSRDHTYENTKALAEYAFQNFEQTKIADQEAAKKYREISETACVTLPKEIKFKDLKSEFQPSGELRYFYEGNLVGVTTAKLAAEHKIEGAALKDEQQNEETKQKTKSWKMIWILVSVVLIVIVILVILLRMHAIRKRKERMRRRRAMQKRKQEIRKRREKTEYSDL